MLFWTKEGREREVRNITTYTFILQCACTLQGYSHFRVDYPFFYHLYPFFLTFLPVLGIPISQKIVVFLQVNPAKFAKNKTVYGSKFFIYTKQQSNVWKFRSQNVQDNKIIACFRCGRSMTLLARCWCRVTCTTELWRRGQAPTWTSGATWRECRSVPTHWLLTCFVIHGVSSLWATVPEIKLSILS